MREHGALPPFSVRESTRAQRVILKIFPGKGLEVVVPAGFDCSRIPSILHEKREWIDSVFRKIQHRVEPRSDASVLPRTVELKAVNRHYTVGYTRSHGEKTELIHLPDSRLELVGNVTDSKTCRELLHLWLKHQGRRQLIPWLHSLSEQTGLKCTRVQVREQKSRWGSCSSRGTISLNCRLLFLPPEWVRYVLIHELCHTVHLDHSPRFWDLVARLEPSYKTLDAGVNRAHHHVPSWALKQ